MQQEMMEEAVVQNGTLIVNKTPVGSPLSEDRRPVPLKLQPYGAI